MKKLTGVYLEFDNSEKVNIVDLKLEDYEQFLETIHNLRLAYISVKTRKDNDQEKT